MELVLVIYFFPELRLYVVSIKEGFGLLLLTGKCMKSVVFSPDR